MLIGLTNTEGTEDLHINDWMVQKGHAVFGQMVCIRPPNYPFRRFLECEYEVNSSRCKTLNTVPKIVTVAANNYSISSSPRSNCTDRYLEFYKTLSKLHRSSRSGKILPRLTNGASSEDSKMRRDDPKIFNGIKSGTIRDRIRECNYKLKACSTTLGDRPSKYGTDFLREMCEARARCDIALNGQNKSDSSGESKASSSSASVIVPAYAIRDHRTGDAQLTDKNNDPHEQLESLIGRSPKSTVSNLPSVSAPGFIRDRRTSDPQLADRNNSHYDQDVIREGRTDDKQLSDINNSSHEQGKSSIGKCSKYTVSNLASAVAPEENIKDRRTSDAEVSDRKNSHYEQGNSPIVSNPKSTGSRSVNEKSSEECDREFGDLPLHLKSLPMNPREVSEFGTIRSLNGGHGRMDPIDWSDVRSIENNSKIIKKASTNSPGKSDPKQSLAKETLRNVKLSSSKADDPAGIGTFSRRRDVTSCTKSTPSNPPNFDDSGNDPNGVSTANLTVKLAPAKIALWNMVERMKKNAISTEKNHNQADVVSSTESRSNDLYRVQEVSDQDKEESTKSRKPNHPTSTRSSSNMVDKIKNNPIVIEKNHSLTDVVFPVESSSNDLSRVQEVSEEVKEASTKSRTPIHPTSIRSLWDIVEQTEEPSLESAQFHSLNGGHGRMDPVAWSDVRKKILNPESADDLTVHPVTTKVPSKSDEEAWINLPKANRVFLNLVNSALPEAHVRDSVFVPEGNIRTDQDVSPTVRRLMKRLEEENSGKRVRLMIPHDVLELLKADGDKNEDEGNSIVHEVSSSREDLNGRVEQQKSIIPSNGVHNLSDFIVMDSGSSNSPKESSKLTDPSTSVDSTESTEKDVQDLQTSDNASNATREILKTSGEASTASLDRPGSSFNENYMSGAAPAKSRIPADSERTNTWIENRSLKPSSILVKELSKIIDARLDSTNGSELDSDDLCSCSDDDNEQQKNSHASSKHFENRADGLSEERRDFDDYTASLDERSLDRSPKKIDEVIVASSLQLEERQGLKVKSLLKNNCAGGSNESERYVDGGELVGAGESGPLSVSRDYSTSQLSKINPPFCPVFDDTVLESDTEEWDFSPHCIIPEYSAGGENFEDIDEGVESSEEVRPYLKSLENNTKKASSFDDSSLEISENDERASNASGSSRQET